MRIEVMGASILGGYFCGMLARGGNRVTLIARGAYMKAISEAGLRVIGHQREFTVRSEVTDVPRTVGPVELFLLTVKTYRNLFKCVRQSTHTISIISACAGASRQEVGILYGMTFERSCRRILAKVVAARTGHTNRPVACRNFTWTGSLPRAVMPLRCASSDTATAAHLVA